MSTISPRTSGLCNKTTADFFKLSNYLFEKSVQSSPWIVLQPCFSCSRCVQISNYCIFYNTMEYEEQVIMDDRFITFNQNISDTEKIFNTRNYMNSESIIYQHFKAAPIKMLSMRFKLRPKYRFSKPMKRTWCFQTQIPFARLASLS